MLGPHLSLRRLFVLASCVAVVFSPSFLSEPDPVPSKIVFWTVGQGDFISLITPERCLVFDVGGSIAIPQNDLFQLRERCGHLSVDLYVSHFDKDHISNYRRLMAYINLNKAYFSHLDSKSLFGKNLVAYLKSKNVIIKEIRQGYERNEKSFKLRCLWPPPGPLRKSENERSLVFNLRVHGRTIVLTGDLPTTMEKKVLSEPIDILKVGHHGSRSSTSLKFLEMLKPKACVVSVGRVNTYGHPTHEALSRMIEKNCAILRTDRLGNIEFDL